MGSSRDYHNTVYSQHTVMITVLIVILTVMGTVVMMILALIGTVIIIVVIQRQ